MATINIKAAGCGLGSAKSTAPRSTHIHPVRLSGTSPRIDNRRPILSSTTIDREPALRKSGSRLRYNTTRPSFMSSGKDIMAVPLYVPVGAILVWLLLKVMRIGRRAPDAPPGPPTIPLLGNLHMFPKENAYLKLTEWAKTYGGIYSLKMGPGNVIVITDPLIMRELLDKRSQLTADRPASHIGERVTGGMNMGLARYTEDWRAMRRAAHEMLTPNACTQHLPIQLAEASQLLHDCLVEPKHFYDHIRRYSFSTILSVLFGKRAPRLGTQEFSDYHDVQHQWEDILAPGATPPIDFLPFLKYVPKFLAPWKAQCDHVRHLQRKLYFGLLEETEERVAKGLENGSFMEQVLARQAEFGLNREHMGYIGGGMMEGGSDTTSSMLQSLILALAAFPEAQEKAQAELDKVVGHDRTPTPEDFPHLPYMHAMIKELHRWCILVPLALPHAATEELNYGQYRIPAGSTIFMNAWGMLHDPEVFERPSDFWPDRWILNEFGTKAGIDNTNRRINIWFGSGRRLCPGMHLATNSVLVNATKLIWAFHIQPPVDHQTGQEIPVDTSNYSKGILAFPERFECRITPRSSRHAAIIEQEFAEATANFTPYEHGLREEDRLFVESQRV